MAWGRPYRSYVCLNQPTGPETCPVRRSCDRRLTGQNRFNEQNKWQMLRERAAACKVCSTERPHSSPQPGRAVKNEISDALQMNFLGISATGRQTAEKTETTC